MSLIDLWCDGGIIRKNPSEHGGTWAYCHVQDGKMIHSESGIVFPAQLEIERVTNNQTELYAALSALQSVPENWRGTLYTDSKITMHRLTDGIGFKGVPQWMRLRALSFRRFRKWKIQLVKGHPNKWDLKSGVDSRGRIISKWNVWCDEECQRLAKEFLSSLPL